LLSELAIYADDCAGGKAEPEDLLNLAKKFLQRCEAFRFYVNPAKFQLIVEELVWLGRLLRDGKVLLDPSYVEGVTALHKQTGGRRLAIHVPGHGSPATCHGLRRSGSRRSTCSQKPRNARPTRASVRSRTCR
jgi:hypothetical protein